MLITLIDIDQFRSIAWFNLALGLAFIVLQLLLFRGESDCKKCNVKHKSKRRERKKRNFDIKWKAVLISFLVLTIWYACIHTSLVPRRSPPPPVKERLVF